jgi:SAM-dependent methyltransferase
MTNSKHVSEISQESVFVEKEADAWFLRNKSSVAEAAPQNNMVLSALKDVPIESEGALIDIGGAAGKVSAGFLRDHPGWKCRIVELSKAAIEEGAHWFPALEFSQGSVGQKEGFPWNDHDVAIVAGVLCCVDRRSLAQAIANIDATLKDGGYLVVSDFDTPYLRKNPYKYVPGVHTFKQDYASAFTALGTYHTIQRRSVNLTGSFSAGDATDPYDQQWATTVLRKDLLGRYAGV